MCGTAAECIAISEVDFRTMGIGRMGHITRPIKTAFHAAITGKGPRSPEWLTYVNTKQTVAA